MVSTRNPSLVVESYSEELRLLLSLIAWDNRPELPTRLLDSTPNLDWDDFLRLAHHHRVYPTVYLHLKLLQHPAVPQAAMQVLASEYRRNSFFMLQLCGEMERVGRAMGNNGVRCLVLKGPVLAEALYGDMTKRTSKDLDLLVPPSGMECAEQILHDCGYEETIPEPSPLVFRLRKDPAGEYHKSYIHPGNKVQIELHWRMNGKHGREPSFDELWEQRGRSPLTPSPVYYLGREHLFYSLVTHGARHGWFRLRWLADIDHMLRQELDHAQLMRMMHAYKASSYGEQALLLCEQLLGTKLHVASEKRASAYAFRLAQLAVEVIKGERDIRYKLMLRTRWQKIIYLLQVISPRRIDWEVLPLPRPLHILYIPLRPFLWLWRKRKKQLQANKTTYDKVN